MWGSGASSVLAAGVSITQSGGSTNVSETGPTSDSYTIVLDTQPTATVEILVDPDSQTNLGAGNGSPILLTFTTSSWNTPQIVTVTAVDDAFVEGAHTSTITHSAFSDDPAYNAIAITNVVANVADNDSAGVVITQSDSSTDVSENGPSSDSYEIVLNSRPSASVVVTVTPDAQVDLGDGPGVAIAIAITPGTWNFPRSVIVTAVDDATAEGPHTSTITHSASSADAGYNGITIDDVVVNVTDNDAAGVTLAQSGGSTNVSEQGATSDTYTIVLVKAPTASVTIDVNPDVQTDLGDGPGVAISLVFTPLNWSVARQVTVTAVDDAIPEGPHTSTITHTATSADVSYHGLSIPSIIANVADNDIVGVTIAQSGGGTSVSETGPTSDSYTIVLDSQPAADVVITVDPDSQTTVGAGGGNPIDLTFTAGNWSTPQTVTVTAVDDLVYEGNHTSTITHTAASSDPNYDQFAIANVTVSLTDNETAGVSITQSAGSTNISEAGPTSDSYTVELDSQPIDDVIIRADPDGQTDLGAGPGVAIDLTFTTGNWNAPQTVTVTAVDDAVAEGAHTSTISHTSLSNDPTYDGITISSVLSNITDNDTAGVMVTESGGSTNVDEADLTSDTYTIVLNSQPTASVTIRADPDTQSTVGAGAGVAIDLTFTTGNWDTPQTVTVTAVDDAVTEGAHSSTIVHSAASSDGNYAGISISNVSASITDNDTAGVNLAQSGGSTDVSETGPTSDTYTIALNSQPTANVTVTVEPDAQSTVGAGAGVAIDLTFTTGNWNTPQTVTVTAVDDAVAEGPHSSTILHTAASSDANYDQIGIADITANITDNDTAGVTIVQSGGSTNVSETGPTSDTFTIALNSQPTANVTITVDPDAQSTVGAGAGVAVDLTFTAGNWSTPQTVTVSAVDDAVAEGAHTSTIVHTAASSDPNYDFIVIADITANITDNDTAAVTIVQSGGSTNVNETGPTSDTYTIALNSQPTASVTITVDPDAQSTLGAGAGVAIDLTFTAGNWNTPQMVTVTAVDDAVQEGPHTSIIVHTAASGDSFYSGIAIANVVANVSDNDVPGVTLTESGGSTDVSEAGPTSDAYTIELNSQPTANVIISVDPDEQTNLGAGAGVAINLTFTTVNWITPQTVTVTAVDDAVAEGPHNSTIVHTASSPDSNYNGIATPNIVAMVTDNDAPGVTLTETDGSTSVKETGPTSDTYTIVLQSRPIADVVIQVDPDVQTDLGAGSGVAVLLAFNASNWDTPRTVVVTAVDDSTPEGPHTSTLVHTVTSADSNYDAMAISDIIVAVQDNDVPGVTIVQTGGTTSASETGPTSDTYTIVLDSQPGADVTISVAPDVQADAGAGAGVEIELVFTASDWFIEQTVTITAVDDLVAEGPHSATIVHTATSADGNYAGISISNVVASITDNDAAGVIVTQSGGSTSVSEAGPTSDTYTIALSSQPTGNVTITVAPDVQSTVGAGAGVAVDLTFTATDWDTPQTVTVTAVDDAVAEGAHTSTIVHTAASGDSNYAGISISNIVASITDNDTADVNLVQSGGSTSLSEAGPTSDSYTIALNSQPTANVTITVTPDVQSTVGAGAGTAINLMFTTGNWSTPQTVTVTAVDDAVAEGAHTSTIVHTAASVDGNYAGFGISNIVANITDNDTAGVNLSQSGGSTSVNETGPTTDTYTIALNSQPTANVTITMDPDVQTDLGAGPGVAIDFTFTAGNWNTPQTVVVTAVDDTTPEGPHTSTIVHSVASADANYNAMSVPNVVAAVIDNDLPGITITEVGGSTDLNETGPTSDTYTIVLDSQPTAAVSITATPDAQASMGAGAGQPTTVTFQPGNWNVPRMLVVTAVDDVVVEGSHVSTIVHSAVSADANYDGMVIADVVANITDNDTLGVLIVQSGGSTDVSEQGPTADTYSLVLDSQPSADVVITVDPDNQVVVGAGVGVAIDLTFTTANWNTPQTVTVTAVDDAVAEGAHVSIIEHSVASADSSYQGAMVSNVYVNIQDNDIAGVSVTQSSGSTRVNEGSSDAATYTIVLTSRPLGNVVIRVDPDSQTNVGAGSGNPIDLTFTPSDWNAPQTITVWAVDDAIVEGIHTSTISHTAISTDPAYNGIEVVNLDVEIIDDDEGLVQGSGLGGGQDGGPGGEQQIYRQTTTILLRRVTPCGVAFAGPMAMTLLAMCVGKRSHRCCKRRRKTD